MKYLINFNYKQIVKKQLRNSKNIIFQDKIYQAKIQTAIQHLEISL